MHTAQLMALKTLRTIKERSWPAGRSPEADQLPSTNAPPRAETTPEDLARAFFKGEGDKCSLYQISRTS